MSEPLTITALTLHQPWASLVAFGAKHYETRSWRPPESQLRPGDLLAIHAGARPVRLDELSDELVGLAPTITGQSPGNALCLFALLPRGRVVAVCRYLGAARTDHADDVSRLERACGDWRPGRYAWMLEVVWRDTIETVDLIKAGDLAACGRQRFWHWAVPAWLADELVALKGR